MTKKSRPGALPNKKNRGYNALTPKQLQYCIQYAKCLNQTQAYRIAFNKLTSTDNACSTAASRLMAMDKVQAKIIQLTNDAKERTTLSVSRTLQEIARIAYADPRELFDTNGALKPVAALSDDVAATIGSIETDDIYDDEGAKRGMKSKLKQWNKLDALEKAMKYHGLYKEDNNQKQENVEITVELVK